MPNQQTEPPQHQQQQPGSEVRVQPQPSTDRPEYRGSGMLDGKIAIITG